MANEDEVYRVDTVPPPEGEDDAYNAPTKVGVIEAPVLESMKQASLTGNPLKPPTLPKIGGGDEPPIERTEILGDDAIVSSVPRPAAPAPSASAQAVVAPPQTAPSAVAPAAAAPAAHVVPAAAPAKVDTYLVVTIAIAVVAVLVLVAVLAFDW